MLNLNFYQIIALIIKFFRASLCKVKILQFVAFLRFLSFVLLHSPSIWCIFACHFSVWVNRHSFFPSRPFKTVFHVYVLKLQMCTLLLLWGHYHFELIFEHFFTSTKNLDMGQTHSPFGYARISKALVQLPLSNAAILIELEWITSFKRNAKFLFALRPICIWNFNGQVRWSFSFYSSVLQTPIYSQSWCFFLFEHCTLQLPTTLRVNLLLHHSSFYQS